MPADDLGVDPALAAADGAIVRRSDLPLCASCDARRSTLGKGSPATRVPATPRIDQMDWIAAAQARLRQAEAELAAAATRGRQHGHSWTAIGQRLGITRQTAHKRFKSPSSATQIHSSNTKRPN